MQKQTFHKYGMSSSRLNTDYCLSYFVISGVPSPRRLHLERQFTRSVLLSWKPADLPADQVKGYGVYANGELRLMIKGSSKTKALLEDIDPQEVRFNHFLLCMNVNDSPVNYGRQQLNSNWFQEVATCVYTFRLF